jgi:hypothetical protein
MQQDEPLMHRFDLIQYTGTNKRVSVWSGKLKNALDEIEPGKQLNQMLPVGWAISAIVSTPIDPAYYETCYEITWKKTGGFELWVYFDPPNLVLSLLERVQVHVYLSWIVFAWAYEQKKFHSLAQQARQSAEETNIPCVQSPEIQAIIGALRASGTKDGKGWQKLRERCQVGRAILIKEENGETRYHECFIFGQPEKIFDHRGVLGEVGSQTATLLPRGVMHRDRIMEVMKPSYDVGYRLVPKSRYKDVTLVFETSAGLGNEAELALRHEIEEMLDELLGRTCLGSVDGGSIGGGTMEVFCEVIEPKLAELTIRAHIRERFGREILRIEID